MTNHKNFIAWTPSDILMSAPRISLNRTLSVVVPGLALLVDGHIRFSALGFKPKMEESGISPAILFNV
jgi:hypothetical protein